MHLSAYCRRWTDWVLTTDKRQRIRLAMAGLAALLMVCCLSVMNAVAAAGLLAAGALCGWLASRAGASSPDRARLMNELRLDRQVLADWSQRQ